MTKECKSARNTVLIPILLLIALMVFLSSCARTHTLCPAYANVEVKNEMKWRK